MTTRYDSELAVAIADAERAQERVLLLKRLQEIENGAGTATKAVAPKPKTAVAAAAPTGKRRGRPRKDQSAATVKPADGEKRIDLPSLVLSIGKSANKSLTLPEYVTLVREAGYKSDAKDFSNMLYQCLLKLTNKGCFKKNKDEVDGKKATFYEFVTEAA